MGIRSPRHRSLAEVFGTRFWCCDAKKKTPRPSGNSKPWPGKHPASSSVARQKFSKHPFQFKYLFIHKDARRWIFVSFRFFFLRFSLFGSCYRVCFLFLCFPTQDSGIEMFRSADGTKHRNNIYGSVVVEWERNVLGRIMQKNIPISKMFAGWLDSIVMGK